MGIAVADEEYAKTVGEAFKEGDSQRRKLAKRVGTDVDHLSGILTSLNLERDTLHRKAMIQGPLQEVYVHSQPFGSSTARRSRWMTARRSSARLSASSDCGECQSLFDESVMMADV